jgi:CxxC-x17-CxxC domain-containing protein
MNFSDRQLPCRDCGQLFVWTAGEQQFFDEKGLSNLPVRCTACRTARKARLGIQNRAQSEVICASCGSPTTVPFVPRHGKPVFCAKCFSGQRETAEQEAAVAAV